MFGYSGSQQIHNNYSPSTKYSTERGKR